MSMERIKRDAQQADQMIAELGRESEDDTTGVDGQTSETDTGDDEGLGQTPTTDQGVAQNDSDDTQVGGTDQGEDSRQDDAKLWEQRYRSLDGMIQARDRQIQQLHELLAGMQEQRSQSPSGEGTSGQPATPSSDPLVTKEDEDTFGGDLVDMARRVAREEFNRLAQDIQRQFDGLKSELQGVSKTAEVSAQDSFESRLDKVAPNWRSLDSDPRFLEWLDKSSARKQVFVAAVQQRDVPTVGEFFNEFTKLVDPGQGQEAAGNKRKQELERQVAPGKSKKTATPPSQTDEKKTWTRSEIATTFANKKQYAADEFARLEREIAAAQREGRVDFSR